MSRKLLLLMFLTLLIGTLNLASRVEKVRADVTIHIRVDGSIDPPTALISTADNITYTLLNNVNGSVLIERSGMVINGNNCTIQTYGLTNVDNVTIVNTIVMDGGGVWLDSSSHIVLCGNVIAQNGIGIELQLSSNNNISGNIIALNDEYGILMENSSGNVISNNYIGGMETPQGSAFCQYGIETRFCSNNTITQNNITLCNRAIRFESYSTLGEDASNNNITENNIQPLEWGLWFDRSSNNTIMRNNITGVGSRGLLMSESTGIYLIRSFFNTIAQNEITSLSEGVKLDDFSSVNTLTQNDVKNNDDGIVISESTLDVVTYNNIENNSQAGIRVQYGEEGYVNSIYHNSFVDNGIQAVTGSFLNNTWDDGYASGGNYWSNYTGVDSYCGLYQNETGSDGIRDAQYTIDADNVDRYPLVAPISTFDAGIWNSTTYSVDFISNSTVSCVDFTLTDPSHATLAFNVTGETGTQGFCRVCIPKALINGSLVLWKDGAIISEPQYRILPASDESYTCIYITYTHSQHTLTITGTTTIPEFPSFLVLPLFMLLTMVTVMLMQRRIPRKQKNVT